MIPRDREESSPPSISAPSTVDTLSSPPPPSAAADTAGTAAPANGSEAVESRNDNSNPQQGTGNVRAVFASNQSSGVTVSSPTWRAASVDASTGAPQDAVSTDVSGNTTTRLAPEVVMPPPTLHRMNVPSLQHQQQHHHQQHRYAPGSRGGLSGIGHHGGNSTRPFQRDDRKLFVGGLPADVTDEEFRLFFEQFGAVRDSIVMFDHATSRSRGFGFVTFVDIQVARSLVIAPPNTTSHAPPQHLGGRRMLMRDKWIEIKPAQPKQQIGRGNVPTASTVPISSPSIDGMVGPKNLPPMTTTPVTSWPQTAPPLLAEGMIPVSSTHQVPPVPEMPPPLPVAPVYYPPTGVVPGYFAPYYTAGNAPASVPMVMDPSAVNHIPVLSTPAAVIPPAMVGVPYMQSDAAMHPQPAYPVMWAEGMPVIPAAPPIVDGTPMAPPSASVPHGNAPHVAPPAWGFYQAAASLSPPEHPLVGAPAMATPPPQPSMNESFVVGNNPRQDLSEQEDGP